MGTAAAGCSSLVFMGGYYSPDITIVVFVCFLVCFLFDLGLRSLWSVMHTHREVGIPEICINLSQVVESAKKRGQQQWAALVWSSWVAILAQTSLFQQKLANQPLWGPLIALRELRHFYLIWGFDTLANLLAQIEASAVYLKLL